MKKLTVPAMFLALSVAGCGDLSETPTEPGSMGEPAGGAVLSEMEMVPELAESGLPYVLVLDEEEPPSDVEGLVAAAGGRLLFHFPEVGLAVVEAGAAEFPALAAQSIGDRLIQLAKGAITPIYPAAPRTHFRRSCSAASS